MNRQDQELYGMDQLVISANSTETEIIHTRAALNNIHDDCLLNVCKYLNIYDVRNLASTCQRLREFANLSLIPKIVKKIEVKVIRELDTVLHWESFAVTFDGLQSQIMQFGHFVEHISLTGTGEDDLIWPQFGQILRYCPNLKTLRIKNVCRKSLQLNNEYRQDISEVLCNVSSHLKELHWIDSTGMTTNCSVVFKRLPELEKITVTGNNRIDSKLFAFCRNLTYLDVERYDASSFRTSMYDNQLQRVFNNHEDTLRTLKLKNFGYVKSDSIFQLIGKQLKNLEVLEITDRISNHFPKNGKVEFRQINHLELNCGRININSVMKTLCDLGLIESLTIQGGQFTGDMPLTFKKLQKLCWVPHKTSAAFIKALTQAHMPKLRDLTISYEHRYFNEIVKLVESNRSLTSLCVAGIYDPSLLVIKIIEILKVDVSGGRPFLMLDIPSKIGDEEVIELTSNKSQYKF